MFSVVEDFLSINGEGAKSGKLAVFIRFAGCNLDCSYCDTKWANEPNVPSKQMALEPLLELIKSYKVPRVTLTGGEPLLQSGIYELVNILAAENIAVEIETNGSVAIALERLTNRQMVSFTMDYKLASSNMEANMNISNIVKLTKQDVLKFVVGSVEELETVKSIMLDYNLEKTTNVFISPVYGGIDSSQLADFLKENLFCETTMQLQLHKLIWGFDSRGC